MHGRLALSDNRGFTLIELLVEILIIAILAMVALPIFTNQRTKAQDLRAQATIRTVATALGPDERTCSVPEHGRCRAGGIW